MEAPAAAAVTEVGSCVDLLPAGLDCDALTVPLDGCWGDGEGAEEVTKLAEGVGTPSWLLPAAADSADGSTMSTLRPRRSTVTAGREPEEEEARKE